MKPLYIYILSGLAVAAALYFFMKKKKEASNLQSSENKNNTTLVSNPAATNPAGTATATNPMIKKGSSGDLVKTVQMNFNTSRNYAISQGYTPPPALATDGNFGTATENALLFMYGYREIRPTDRIDINYLTFPYPLNWLYTYQRYRPAPTAPTLASQIGGYAL